jgi:cell division protein FtsQ
VTDITEVPGSPVALPEEGEGPGGRGGPDEEGRLAPEVLDGAHHDGAVASDVDGCAPPPDSGAATDGGTDPSPMVHPRLWQRRLAVLGDAGRKRLRWVVGAVALLAVACVSVVVLHTPLLAVRHVTVHGAQHTGAASVLAAAGLDGNPPLIDVNPAQAAVAVERLPWVQRAVVVRRWPDSVVVQVTERTPVGAFAGAKGQVAQVDASGRVLAWEPAPAVGPALVGPVPVGPPGTDVAGADNPAVTVAATLPGAIAGRVTSVTVDRVGDVTLWLGTRLEVRLGNDSALRAKLVALQSVMAGAAVPGGSEIDVTVPGAPTVGPLPPGAHPPVVGR